MNINRMAGGSEGVNTTFMKRMLNCSFKELALLFLCFVICLTSFAQTNMWIEKKAPGASGPPPSFRSKSFTIESNAYLLIFDESSQKLMLWKYASLTNKWEPKSLYPGGAVSGMVSFSIGNKGYVGIGTKEGGTLNNSTNEFWEYDPITNGWTRKADFPGGARSEAAGFSIANKGYIGTGQDNGGSGFKDFWEYNPTTDTWVRKADFKGEARTRSVGFSIGAKGYIGTGYLTNGSGDGSDFWEYDPATDQWLQKADFAGGPRESAIGFGIQNKGYIGGGSFQYYSNRTDFWQFDPDTDLWTQQTNYPESFQGNVSFVIGNKGYAGSGMVGAVSLLSSNLFQFVPAENSWLKVNEFSQPARWLPAAFSIGSKGYWGTGTERLFLLKKDFWEYDQVTDSWSQKADYGGDPRSGAFAFTLGGRGYVGGGRTRVFTGGNFWEYDPVINTWTRKADYPLDQATAAVAFTLNNKAYVSTAGNLISSEHTDFYEYDPLIDRWTAKAAFPGTARVGAVGFSTDNKGYMGTGGIGYPGENKELVDFWQYDPLTNSWTRKSDFPGVGRREAVAFSIQNIGYLGTGFNYQNSGYLKDFWQYDGVSDTWKRKADLLGKGRIQAVGFAIGKKGYISAGDGPANADLWEYIPSNQPPIAAGFVMLNYYPDAHLLNAWGSYDPEGGPVKFLWKKVGGPAPYKMLYENASTPVISDLVTGTYTFQLTVTDQEGATATTDVSFSVKVNQPPVANGFVMMYYYPNAHLLNAWGSYDPEGGPIKFWWTKIAGPAQYQMLYPEASTPVISNLLVGTYSFQLKVTDNEGAIAYDTVDIINTTPLSASNDNYHMLNEADRAALVKTKLLISPNPAYDQLNFKWSSDYSGTGNIVITDLSGKTVLLKNMNKQNHDVSTILAINNLKPGAYYLFIDTKNHKSLPVKFIKQ